MRGEKNYLQQRRWPEAYRPPPPPRDHPSKSDPHRHTTVRIRLEEEAYLRDMTPGLDESHCIPGHPDYEPRRS